MPNSDLAQLQQRVQVLEDIAAIQALQYGYWNCVDCKDPVGMRQLLADDGIAIDFPGQPRMSDPDAFVQATAISPGSWQGTHAGSAPRIYFKSSDEALGAWLVRMIGYDFEQKIIVRMALDYVCRYVRQGGIWKIKAMTARQQAMDVAGINEGQLTSVAFGPVGT